MPLAAGTRLGAYEIISLIGAGGMGEVYHARDTKLDRDVAIKILPPALAQHPDRLARFEREAKTLATLNHPNIAAIFGLEDNGSTRAIVMELVEGPTLADRIKSGPLPLDEALKTAAVIADALETAHEKGIIHRDLKPANIKASDGVVKVLDFGLATAMQPADRDSSDAANSPTLTIGATEAGVILGTAAYMSPEQAAGKRVDRRADIWSFGVVLWEMLAGQRLFAGGETVSHTLADVLRQEIDFSKVAAPRPIVELLKRCLDRDVKTRLRDIGEARIAIQRFLADPSRGTEPQSPPEVRTTSSRIAWAVAGALLVATAALSYLHFRESPPERQTLRYTIAPPDNGAVHSFAISPDGRYVTMAVELNGKRQLWLRPLDALQWQPMQGTDGATYPFWSPDNRNIGFFADSKLKRIAVNGGPPQTLCNVQDGRGGSWGNNDVIVFSPSGAAATIQSVSAGGGDPRALTKSEGLFRFPLLLPGGRHLLYQSASLADNTGVHFISLNGDGDQRVLPDLSSVAFAPAAQQSTNGHLVFIRESALMAQAFDATSGKTMGDAFRIADGVELSGGNSYAPLSASEQGVLLFASHLASSNQIVWYDRSGQALGPVGERGARMAALAPNGRTVIYSRSRPGGSDLWLRDLVRGTDLRFTSQALVNSIPIWSPKGDRIAFASTRGGQFDLYQKPVGGASQEQLLLANRNLKIPYQWSPAGLVYFELGTTTRQDLWVLPIKEDGTPAKPELFLQTPFGEYDGQISPDGHWMAYTSEESGQREVYVRPFPKAEGGPWRISTAGGEQPRWRGDTKELFYLAADGKLTSVSVKATSQPKPAFEPGTPEPLFDSHIAPRGPTQLVWEYDVTSDGKRFLVNTTAVSTSPPLTVVVNWNAGLKK